MEASVEDMEASVEGMEASMAEWELPRKLPLKLPWKQLPRKLQ